MSMAQDDPRAGAGGPDFDVLVIGCGFAGICMGIHLRRMGLRFAILERASDIGGTWRDNTYPGCACDIPSHLYSFSFELNPDWSQFYPSQPEILEYLRRCVDKYGIREHIRLDCEVAEAVFDEAGSVWRVRTKGGDCLSAEILVSAMGLLSRPAFPEIPGIERFRGEAFHASQWHHGFKFAGKTVAVIGTGASAIQIIPQIAAQAGKLAVYQRTAAWILPKWDWPIKDWQRALLRRVPGAMRLVRFLIYLLQESLALGFMNPKLLRPARKLALAHLARGVTDPRLREVLTPNYTIGCKRLLLSNDYYPALSRANVELETRAITEVRERGIVTHDEVERAVDAIVFATGFRAADILSPVRIVGRGGVELNAVWREGAEAYRGINVAGFPNMFMLMGPNTLLGHNSIVLMIEAQVHYVRKCLEWLRQRQGAAIDVRPDAQTRFNRGLQQRLQRTVWASGCKSYYLDARGKNVTLWPGSTARYWMQTRRLSPGDYALSRDAASV